MTEASLQALAILRRGDNMQWYVVPLLAVVAYLYLCEVEKRNWSTVYLGIAVWGGELIWEMTNGLILHFTQRAALWSTPGPTAYLIYVGINVEITLFFAVATILLIKALPPDPKLKILGVSNRILIPVAGGVLAVGAELVLHRCGMLVWDWRFWGWPHCYLILAAYCGPALAVVWLHDHARLRSKRRAALVLPLLAGACHLVFATWLGWV